MSRCASLSVWDVGGSLEAARKTPRVPQVSRDAGEEVAMCSQIAKKTPPSAAARSLSEFRVK